jgi:ATP synthase F1 delta subunit
MFISRHWASAFVNSVERDNGRTAAGIYTLKALTDFGSSLPGLVSGRAAAIALEPLVRNAVAKARQGQETAVRFFLLMVKKNKLCHAALIINEIKEILDEKNGVIKVSAEYAFEPEREFISAAEELIKKRTGAARVELTGRINKELVGGYRLKIGDKVIDASIRRQLLKMEACLTAVDGGS